MGVRKAYPPWWLPNLSLAVLFTSLISHAFSQGLVKFLEPGSMAWFITTFAVHTPFVITMIFLLGGLIEHIGFLFSGRSKSKPGSLPDELPLVCVQLPMYNEHAVARRAIEASCALDWPRDKLEIQVLDDSTDADTRVVVDDICASMVTDGHDCRLMRRTRRDGYKAGALEAGRRRTAADLILILDTDFLPTSNFLRRAVPYFYDKNGRLIEDLAMVQTQWGHLNHDESFLTSAQSLWVDDHHTVQMSWRSATWNFVNFTGTAGIWRADAIEKAGGWRSASLVEDCELSFRHLFAGYRTRFVKELVVPAELPATYTAYKAQQKRWTQGWVQLQRMHFLTLLCSYRTNLARRIHLIYHMTIPWQWALWGFWILLMPFLISKGLWFGELGDVFAIGVYFVPTFVYGIIFTIISSTETKSTYEEKLKLLVWMKRIARIVPYTIINTGMLPHQFTAFSEGLFGSLHCEFERTPKAATVTGSKNAEKTTKARMSRFKVKVHVPYVLAEVFFVVYNLAWALFFYKYGRMKESMSSGMVASCVMLLMWFYGDHMGTRLFGLPDFIGNMLAPAPSKVRKFDTNKVKIESTIPPV